MPLNSLTTLKRFIVTLLFVASSFDSDSQGWFWQDSSRIVNDNPDIIQIRKGEGVKGSPKIHFRFRDVSIKDVRYDTSYIGAKVYNSPIRKERLFKKTQLAGGLTSAATAFLNDENLFEFGSSEAELVCFIKHFRFSQFDSVVKKSNGEVHFSKVDLEVETYLLSNGKYFPAFRQDTSFSEIRSGSKGYDCISESLMFIAQKAAGLDMEKVLSKNGYAEEQINDHYAKRFSKPILQATSFKPAIYRDAREFINNTPGYTEFEFRSDKKATVLYVKDESGEFQATRDIFAYYDGRHMWIQINNEFRQLVKTGNTFCFIADLNVQRPEYSNLIIPVVLPTSMFAAGVSTATLTTGRKNKDLNEGYFLYQLDMETGKYR